MPSFVRFFIKPFDFSRFRQAVRIASLLSHVGKHIFHVGKVLSLFENEVFLKRNGVPLLAHVVRTLSNTVSLPADFIGSWSDIVRRLADAVS
jgi:hypothetical protein